MGFRKKSSRYYPTELNKEEFLVEVSYVSIDPAMRGWISTVGNYSEPVAFDETMRSFGVGKIISSTNELDWSAVANITGDIATVKKTIQTLNNRVNGMHSPKVQEMELMQQLIKNQQNQQVNGRMSGG